MMLKVDRRNILRGAVGLLATAAFAESALAQSIAPSVPATPVPSARSLSLRHLHTNETLDNIVYHDGVDYLPNAMQAINILMRDWRRNEIADINPGALDILFNIQQNLRAQGMAPGVCEIICGYRAPHTNAMLRGGDGNSGVAERSLHMEAQAIDMRFSGAPLVAVKEAAWSLQAGGVGYYPQPRNNFVHVDTGRVRRWG